MALLKFLFLLPMSLGLAKIFQESFQDQKPIFGTKTAYNWLPSTNDFFRNPPQLHGRVHYKKQNCTAIHVYTILRHGARNPGLRDTKHMSGLEKKLRKIKTFTSVTEALKGWKNPFSESAEGQLIKLGWLEHVQNARHFMRAFHDVLTKGQRLEPLRLVSSTKQRCLDSMEAFRAGIKEYLQKHQFHVDDFNKKVILSHNNSLLRFYDYCKKYQKEVKKNKTANADYHKFFKTRYISKVVQRVNQKFNVNESFFDKDDVRVMYVLCAFEQCLQNTSNWCPLFTPDDTLPLEYLLDIKQYWVNAYGHKVNYQQSCPLMKDLLHTIETSVRAHRTRKNYTKGHFLFGHGETLAPIYSDLGLFKDAEPLRAQNFKDQFHRRFRSSYILPFAANIAIVTYHCVNEEGIYRQRTSYNIHAEDTKDYVLQMYLNERLIEIPDCGSTCLINDFLKRYKKIESCEFNKICHLNNCS